MHMTLTRPGPKIGGVRLLRDDALRVCTVMDVAHGIGLITSSFLASTSRPLSYRSLKGTRA